jgi:hypothetical protein
MFMSFLVSAAIFITHTLFSSLNILFFFCWMIGWFPDLRAESEYSLRWVREEGQEDPPQD